MNEMRHSAEEKSVLGSVLIHCGRWLKSHSRTERYKQLKAIRRNVDTLILLHRKEEIRSE
jgi:hypothetical protein